ncbi:MAG: hypothetical protein ACEQSR_16585 [Candidatus Methylacidiphilales bacterium]
MNFSFNVIKWLNQNIAVSKRKPRIVKFLIVILTPIQTIHTRFMEFRAEIIFRTNYSSQQGSLAALLNKRFESLIGIKQFRIETIDDQKERYYFPSSTEPAQLFNPIYFGLGWEANSNPIYIGSAKEYDNSISFIVYAPVEAMIKETEINFWVNYYRFVSKNFKIIYF